MCNVPKFISADKQGRKKTFCETRKKKYCRPGVEGATAIFHPKKIHPRENVWLKRKRKTKLTSTFHGQEDIFEAGNCLVCYILFLKKKPESLR